MAILGAYLCAAIAVFFLSLLLIGWILDGIWEAWTSWRYRRWCARRRAFERTFMRRCEL